MVTALFISTVASQIKMGAASQASDSGSRDVEMLDSNGVASPTVLADESQQLNRKEERDLTRDLSFQFEGGQCVFFDWRHRHRTYCRLGVVFFSSSLSAL